ncbi:hypothetical protein GCM10009017_10440 [Halarchaeum rubridurum]|uniref:Uncharacterized protein n=1 Tax=Halarchaeum rubridurum TaxID=489911 RepID=A0A830FLH5_9EURY|nr:hypothetical protein GCM10009017_10440 [Halarchaeum rubridurum]
MPDAGVGEDAAEEEAADDEEDPFEARAHRPLTVVSSFGPFASADVAAVVIPPPTVGSVIRLTIRDA